MQQREVEILSRVEAGSLDVETAAQLLGVGLRQLRRKRALYRTEGMAGVVHGNGGRTPPNRTDPTVVARIVALAGPSGRYAGLNVSHLQELLARDEQIAIGRSTLDRLLRQQGLRQRTLPAPPLHRRRRERRCAEGMLLQMDGSPFAWLEGRGPTATLTGAIDDATGKVVFLHFRPTEDQVGYLLLLRQIAQVYGLPMALYHDRHTILRSPKQPTLAEQLAGQTPMSQIQRIMHELGIESIPAYSPQAKGRIERLWGTLQDRLTQELRLDGCSTLDAANACLPAFIERYNARFAKEPADPNSAWVPLPANLDIAYYFALRELRKVRADHCIRYAGQTLQLLPSPKSASLVGQKIHVHVVPEGEIYLYHGKQRLAWQLVQEPVHEHAQQPFVTEPLAAVPAAKLQRSTLAAKPKASAKQRAWLFSHD